MDVIILIVLIFFVAWSVLFNINSVMLLRSEFSNVILQAFDAKHKKMKKLRLQQQYFYICCKVVAMVFFAYLIYRLS